MANLDHLPRSPRFWEQVRDCATDLGAFLADHKRNQFRSVTVTGMLAGHHTQLHVFDRSTDRGVLVSVQIETDVETGIPLEEDGEWKLVLSCAELNRLDGLVDAARQAGEED